MRPTPTEQAQRLREMAAIIRATAPAGRYRQTTLVPATYMEWAADTIEELLERVVECCGACGTPTWSSCYLDCLTCGRQFCPACADRICPQHGDSEDQAAAVQEVLAAEGFEDVGVDERGPSHLATHRRVRDFSHGVNPPRYKYEPVDPPTRCTSTICYCNECP